MKVTKEGSEHDFFVVGDGGAAVAADAPDGLGGRVGEEKEVGDAAHHQGVRGRREAQ